MGYPTMPSRHDLSTDQPQPLTAGETELIFRIGALSHAVIECDVSGASDIEFREIVASYARDYFSSGAIDAILNEVRWQIHLKARAAGSAA